MSRANPLVWEPLQEVGDSAFEAPAIGNGRAHVFGGALLARGMEAAARTLPGGAETYRLSAQFLRPGETSAPITYHVGDTHDSRHYAHRRITARQGQRDLAQMTLSAARSPSPATAGSVLPEPAPSAGLAKFQPLLDQMLAMDDGADIRIEEAPGTNGSGNRLTYHFRIPASLTLGPAAAAQYLSFISDRLVLGGPRLQRFARDGIALRPATLDHDLRLHGAIDLSGWCRVEVEWQDAYAPRVCCRSRLFAPDGRWMASAGQTGILFAAQ